MLPTSSETASAAPSARGTWWRASDVDHRAQRVTEKHAEHDRDEHRLRVLQRDDPGQGGDNRERDAPHVDRHADDERVAVPPPLAPFASGLDVAFLSLSGVSGFSIFDRETASARIVPATGPMLVTDFDFALPEDLIAQTAAPRGQSRLLALDRAHWIVRTSLDCRSPGVFATRRCPRRQRHARLCRAAAGSSGTQRWGSRVPTAEPTQQRRTHSTEPQRLIDRAVRVVRGR